MAKGKTVPAPAVTPMAAMAPADPRQELQRRVDEFTRRYQELCRELGMQIVFEPRWAQSKDTGDYRLVIASGVAPIPQDG